MTTPTLVGQNARFTYLARTIIVFLGLLPVAASAQQQGGWRMDPILRVGFESDDNARLDPRTDQEVDLTGLLFNARLNVLFESPRSYFVISPEAVIRKYDDEPDFDSDDIFLNGRYRYQGLRNDFGLRFRYDDQKVRTAERADTDLDVEDPDDIPDDESGRVETLGNRAKWRVLPSWSYEISRQATIGVDLEYINAKYDDVPGDLLIDYTDARLGLDFGYQFTPRTTGLLRATTRQYESDDDVDNEIDGNGIQVGFQTDLSTTTTFRALIGAESADVENGESRTEPVGELFLRRQLETIDLFVLYRRKLNSSGAGRINARDSIDLNATRQLTEKIAAGVGIRAYEAERIDIESADIAPQQYVQLRAQFTWFITRAFSAEFDYRYTVLDRAAVATETANSNQINIWFSYRPNPERP